MIKRLIRFEILTALLLVAMGAGSAFVVGRALQRARD